MTPTTLICRSRSCPLQTACARHAASGTVPDKQQAYAIPPHSFWDEAETAACSGWILAKDME